MSLEERSAPLARFAGYKLRPGMSPAKVFSGPGVVNPENRSVSHHNLQGGWRVLPEKFHAGFHHGRIVENPFVPDEFVQGFGQAQGGAVRTV
jgi:hypothetical protein